MKITPSEVQKEYEWVINQGDIVVPLINDVRDFLSDIHDVSVDHVSISQYDESVSTVFSEGDVAVNIVGLIRCLKRIDVEGDYMGFVVDEILGQELAAMIAGRQPLYLLGQATFYYVESLMDDEGMSSGMDDLNAALAGGFQTRLPGWSWQDNRDRFSI